MHAIDGSFTVDTQLAIASHSKANTTDQLDNTLFFE
jgi:hypothetical protein